MEKGEKGKRKQSNRSEVGFTSLSTSHVSAAGKKVLQYALGDIVGLQNIVPQFTDFESEISVKKGSMAFLVKIDVTLLRE